MQFVDISLHDPVYCYHKIHFDDLPRHLVEPARIPIRAGGLVIWQSFYRSPHFHLCNSLLKLIQIHPWSMYNFKIYGEVLLPCCSYQFIVKVPNSLLFLLLINDDLVTNFDLGHDFFSFSVPGMLVEILFLRVTIYLQVFIY
jgi:hypothetical protein